MARWRDQADHTKGKNNMKRDHRKKRTLRDFRGRNKSRVSKRQFACYFIGNGLWKLFIAGVYVGTVTSETAPTRNDIARAV